MNVYFSPMFKLYLLLISLISTFLHAQQTQVIFDHYGLSAGFNSREAMDIVTTSNGMVWVSSNDGLARFDGKRFKFYKHIEGDTFSLSHNYCQALATDKRGLIWVQSDDNLDVFNPKTERFIHITHKDSAGKKQIVYPRRFSYDSASDIMWVATTRGLFYSKKGNPELHSISELSSDKMLASSSIGAMIPEGSGFLWVTVGNQIIKLHTANGHTEKFTLPGKVDRFINNPAEVYFLSAYLDKNKTLWLGTMVKGLIAFNTQAHTFHQYCFRDYTKEENTISDIEQTQVPGQEQTLWLTTNGYGLATFDMVTKKFTSYNSPVTNNPNGIMGTTYGMYADGKKGLWIGSSSGLHRYDYSKQIFKVIDISSIEKGTALLPVSNMAIQRNENDKDEILWFYIPYRGGYLYDFTLQKIKPLPLKAARYFNMPAEVLCFYIDAKNILWISTSGEGLTGYDIGNDAIVFKAKKPFGETGRWVWSFFEDRDHRLWVGSFNGLYVMDSSRSKINEVEVVNQSLEKNGQASVIESITQDEEGNIWFTADGTDQQTACIGKLNPVNNHLQFVYNEKTQKSINHNPVNLGSIVNNGRGKIFASFKGEGIAGFFSKNSDSLPRFFTTANGLGSNWVNDLVSDKSGNIWCSTSFGFSYYKEAQGIFTNHNYLPNALDNAQGPYLYLSNQGGRVYVGQTNAIRYFNSGVSFAPIEDNQLVFLELRVFNKPYSPNGHLLSTKDVIHLTHRQDMISIEFALLNYTNSADNTYSWKLQGWDKDWNTSNNNIAAYNNLEPGTYTLLVNAANSQGEWTNEPLKLTLKIAYPFYQTWWFISICIISFTGLVYWFVQQRISRIQEKYMLRNKIAADLHDEIGSTLTSISILSNVSQQAMEQQPQQAKEMLKQISAQSKTIQQSMSDIVWSIRPDNDKVEDLVTRMREYAGQTLEHLGIDAAIVADDELAAKTLPMQHRKELLLIFKEAINNIAKHAAATKVFVTLKNGNKYIQLSIADNGKWKGTSSGTGVLSMKARAASMGGTLTILPKETGTEVLASIPVT